MNLADLNEFQKSRKMPAHILENVPILASVIVNKDCNLRCKHCDWPEKHNVDAALFQKEDWQTFIRDFSQKTPNKKTLVISAREPLYDQVSQNKVLGIIQTAKANGIYAGLINNGTLLKGFLEHNPSFRPDFMDISLEGPEKINDRIRGIGSFQKAMDGLRLAVKTIDNLFIAATVTNINIKSLPEFTEYLFQNEGIRRFVFHSLVPGKFVSPEVNLSDNNFLSFMDEIVDLGSRLDFEQVIFDLYPQSFVNFPKIISHLNPSQSDLFVDEYLILSLAKNIFVRFTNLLESHLVSFLVSPEGYTLPYLEMRRVNYLQKRDWPHVKDISSWHGNPYQQEIISLAGKIPDRCFDRECFRFCLGQSQSCPALINP